MGAIGPTVRIMLLGFVGDVLDTASQWYNTYTQTDPQNCKKANLVDKVAEA